MTLSAKLIPLTGTVLLGITSASCNAGATVTPTGCSELARPILTRETPHATLGNTGDPALDWQLYGTAETGQLNSANDDKATGFRIINACEARDAQITALLNRPWWRRLLPG